jgi:hypothetical protein
MISKSTWDQKQLQHLPQIICFPLTPPRNWMPSKRRSFHIFVAKGLFASKHARPDIHTTIAFLCTRVMAPNETYSNKLLRLMEHLNGSKEEVLFLAADNLHDNKWYVDASFAVQKDFEATRVAPCRMALEFQFLSSESKS